MQHVLCSMSAGPDLSNQNMVCPSVLLQCKKTTRERLLLKEHRKAFKEYKFCISPR
ncbi:hypothetical protein B7P43_G10267 [Cryptotermes secundus]|uniref:Uncharacterized protein n=1 Tax=Cryptotermes secundus TaxID=105785 RepID=A0A2J7PED1_9NEOP|nr:hypothetical protein B7P43_G10267 [Cryptotermes secundus]